MLDYWEAFNFLYTIPVLSYYTSAFIFDIYTYKQSPLEKYDSWTRGFAMTSFNLLLSYHVPFNVLYFFIHDRIIRSNDWLYILNYIFLVYGYISNCIV